MSKWAGFLSHFGHFTEKWRFCLKKWSKISFGTTFRVVTNKLDQKHNRWRKVGGKRFWSWATSHCPNDHFWLYILYIFHIYAIFVIFGLNKPKVTKLFCFRKLSHFPSSPHFEAREAIKTRWDILIWNLTDEKRDFFTILLVSYLRCMIYIFFEPRERERERVFPTLNW